MTTPRATGERASAESAEGRRPSNLIWVMPAKGVGVKAIVVAGGDAALGDAAQLVGTDLVIAADSGAAWLASLGVRPDLVVGDMDSVDPALLERLAADGTMIERHPVAKDASDAELAVDRAVRAGADEVVIIGALRGGRLDHELANLLLLADPAWRGRGLRIVRGGTVARALHGGDALALDAAEGDLVTLLPVAGDALGVRTRGLQFALDGEALRFGRSRGLSNRVLHVPASVSLEGGTLLVIETQKETDG
jgi:thiamine pyrophosphokinase